MIPDVFLLIRSFPLICVHSIIRIVLQKAASGQKKSNSGLAKPWDYWVFFYLSADKND
jgi:hypothetical protein